jgi:leader peptidase (prepilin peptidase) / N-methyltransferase
MLTVFEAESVGLVVTSPFLASFLGTVLDRGPKQETVLWCRSRCRSCRGILAARDLIPICSFLALNGRCRLCGAAIPRQFLALELSFVALTLFTVSLIPARELVPGAALSWSLLTLAWFDLAQGRLPNSLTVPLGLGGLVLAVIADVSLADRGLGAAMGFAIPALAAYAYRMWSGHAGLGMGDIKLLSAVGAWVGWATLPFVVLLSSLSALAFLAFFRQAGSDQPLPFGPFISLAACAIWTWTQRGGAS